MKINWLLILQAWAMLWVVIGHSRLFEYDMAAFDTGGESIVGQLFRRISLCISHGIIHFRFRLLVL